MAARRAEEFARGFVAGGTLFDEMGFYYVGPVDGHNLDHLLPVLKNARDSQLDKPILVHVVTKKGKGYPPAEAQRRQVPRRGEVRRHHRQAVQAGGQRAGLPGGVRQGADRRGRGRQEDRRHHRGHAVGHQPRQVRRALPRAHASMSASPSSMASPSPPASPARASSRSRDLLDLPAARLRPGACTTSPSRSCRCASPSTAPAWSAPTARRMPAPSTSPISPACRTSWSWRRPTSSS